MPMNNAGIVLRLTGSRIPSLKNSKRVVNNHLITEPRVKKWMTKAIRDIELQLLCAYRTPADATPTTPSLRSWIVSSMPLDDSISWIPELSIKVQWVEKGLEGAIIEITRLP